MSKMSLGNFPLGLRRVTRAAVKNTNSKANSFLNKAVLVVEDDPVVTQVVRETLISIGIEVLTAETGPQARELFAKRGADIFLVILDYVIPGVEPARLIEHFRSSKSHVKIVITSGYPEHVISKEFKPEAIDGFLPKPYEPMALIGRMNELVS